MQVTTSWQDLQLSSVTDYHTMELSYPADIGGEENNLRP
jgi:hypothetical protein